MELIMLKSKLHRATVTEANLHYVGSITIDEDLMDAAGMFEYEKVLISNITNGNRLETYIIKGLRGSGVICMNGAAAHCVEVGDKVIIMAFANYTPQEVKELKPKVVFVDDKNKILTISEAEKHGEIV
ncbi:aspartate 1-decarboxylase [Elusimicrobium posterum]|uniref:aspartate 1-decarboxylase n=1 Tax=Elusimicrobium posterum TaxID=3116653 RepID=UPI003C793BB2